MAQQVPDGDPSIISEFLSVTTHVAPSPKPKFRDQVGGARPKIAVVSLAASGHMTPMMNLAEKLAERGHDVGVFGPHYIAEKTTAKCKKIGVTFISVSTSPFESDDDFDVEAKKRNVFGYICHNDALEPGLREQMTAFAPHCIVADFCTTAGIKLAREMDLPLVINFAGPVSLAKQLMRAIDLERTVMACGGCACAISPFTPFSMAVALNLMSLGDYNAEMAWGFKHGLVLVNSFFGLEPAGLVPANVLLTGPLTPPVKSAASKLAGSHPKLAKFLETAVAKKQKVVYVTTGSMAKLNGWQVAAIFHGLKATGCRTIWSLKKDLQPLLPDASDTAFFIDSWLPQMDILLHDAVDLVITHCGWGGTLETIAGGKPIVSIPFFGDQPLNARLLQESGCAEPIGPAPPLSFDSTSNGYVDNAFTAASVETLVQKMLGEPAYKQAALRLMRLSVAAGGATKAAERIELAADFGVSYLTNVELSDKMMGKTICSVM